MKKIFIAILAVAAALTAAAQEPDLAAIAAQRSAKADSLSTMIGQVFGTEAAKEFTEAATRSDFILGATETFNGLKDKSESYKQGAMVAQEFFRVQQDMKARTGIEMQPKAFEQAMIKRFADTTALDLNTEIQTINNEARTLMAEITAMRGNDSVPATATPEQIAAKEETLSQNMGRFYGAQLGAMARSKKYTDRDCADLLEALNKNINLDQFSAAYREGRTAAGNFRNLADNFSKSATLKLSEEKFIEGMTAALLTSRTVTDDDIRLANEQATAYMRQTEAFASETSPEAMTNKTMGKLYIEKIMNEDPQYVQSPTGLVYKILNPGKGNLFTANDKIRVMYKGTHVDGTTFDESKQPVSFAPAGVVPGFREALLMMRPGAKMIAVLPSDLGYGARGAGGAIKPFETLIFEIETLGLDEEKPAEAATADPAAEKATGKAATTKKAAAKKATAKKTTRKRK